MRDRLLNLPAVARTLGFALVAIAIGAAALHFRTFARRSDPPPLGERTSADPLAEELAHCQLIAAQAKDDPHCEAVWAENRRRFFTYAPAFTPRIPAASTKSTSR